MTRINTNVPSLVAQNRLQRSNNSLQTALTRLSTGLKINTGADDPAGLIASEALRSEITSANKAISNTRRANQIIATADSALAQVSSLLNDVRGLVVEAANNGALSDDEIAANQLQVDSSLEAINRIAQTTTFQGRKLLDGSMDFLTSAGTNFGRVKNLSISAANLGATGSVALTVNVTSAATRAQVEVANIPDASAPGTTGRITVTNAAGSATTTAQTTDAGGSYTISADPTGTYAGVAGNNVSVSIVAGATAASAQAESAAITTAGGGGFRIGALAGGTKDGAAGNDVTVNVVSGTINASQAASQAITTTSGGEFTVNARAGGPLDGLAGNAVTVSVASGTTAATAQATTAAHSTAGGGSFTINAAAGGNSDGAAGNAVTFNVVSGTTTVLTNATSQVKTTTDSGSFTIGALGTGTKAGSAGNNVTVNVVAGTTTATAQAETASQTLTGGGAFTISAKAGGAADGSGGNAFTVNVVAGTVGSGAATASLAGNVLTVTVNDSADQSLADIATALAGITAFDDNFTFTIDTAGDFASTGTGDDKSAVAFAGGDSVAAEAALVGDVLTITVNDGANETLADIKTALENDNGTFEDNFTFNVGAAGTFLGNGSDDTGTALTSSGGDSVAAEATRTGNVVTITVNDGANESLADIKTALENDNGVFEDNFVFTVANAGTFSSNGSNDTGSALTSSGGDNAAAEATLTGNVLTITVNNAANETLADIKAALENDNGAFETNFTLDIATAGTFLANGSDDTGSPVTSSGGEDAAAATAALVGDVLTITVNNAASQTLANIKTALENDNGDFENNFTFDIATAGNFLANGSNNASAVAFSGGENLAATAALNISNPNAPVLTITVDQDSTTNTLTDIAAALALDSDFAGDFEFNVEDATGVFSPTNDLLASTQLDGGSAAGAVDSINITTPAGAAFNGTITIVQDADVTAAAPTATLDDDNNITITVNNTNATALTAIRDAINDLTGYTAVLDPANAGDGSFTPGAGNDTIATTAITDATSGGVTQDVVFELSGLTGSEVFNVSAGTDIDQLIAQINLVRDATGVQASKDGTTLQLTSVAYGSNANVDLRIISEGTGGTFTAAIGAGSRASGENAVVKVNGVDANTQGNRLSINTSTLDLTMDVEAGFQGSVNFSITGGGAKFQLGPDVVSNQQARIGITSVNTARLGGTSGRLFQLGSGGSAALATDPTTASQIVDEAITQITSLRGRLGAFQRTTLDSNIASLTDTVANLLEAESSIRDADFAQESANLTRSQILVQSGTNVLSLANQNPQNVLSLLR